MNAVAQLRGKHLVDHPMALDPTFPREGVGRHADAKVCFTARTGTGVSSVLMGLVYDVEGRWMERLHEARGDGLLNDHEPIPVLWRTPGDRRDDPRSACGLRELPHNRAVMNLNSRFFDSIRTRPGSRKAGLAAAAAMPHPCDHKGCRATGEFRAPMGRDREGHYFTFCLDHVREYNATYDYFNGMSDDAVAKYQKDSLVGHRPTWNMGVNRAAGPHTADEAHPDSLGIFRARARAWRSSEPSRPRYSQATTKALAALDLDEAADAAAVKSRYKYLVKQLHPDANGGDRTSEDKLREIIRAYNFLKTIKLTPAGKPAGSST